MHVCNMYIYTHMYIIICAEQDSSAELEFSNKCSRPSKLPGPDY